MVGLQGDGAEEGLASAELLSLCPNMAKYYHAKVNGMTDSEVEALPQLVVLALEAIGIFLRFEGLSEGVKGVDFVLVKSTLYSLYGNPTHAMLSAKNMAVATLTAQKRERLVAALSTLCVLPSTLDTAHRGAYRAFPDPPTLRGEGWPFLASVIESVEARLRQVDEFWGRFAERRQAGAAGLVREVEAAKELIEKRHLQSHESLVHYKWALDDCVAGVAATVEGLRKCEGVDFNLPALAAHMGEAPHVLLTVSRAVGVVIGTDPFVEHGRAFAPQLFHSARSVAPTFLPSHKEVSSLLATVSPTAVSDTGSRALEELFKWAVAMERYLVCLEEIQAKQVAIRSHNDVVLEWERQSQRVRALQESLSGGPPAVQGEGGAVKGRSAVVALLAGWGEYDNVSSPLPDDVLREIFAHYDTDSSGGLNRAELRSLVAAIEPIGAQRLDSVVEKVLAEPHDELSFDEFAVVLLRFVQR